MLFCIPTGTLQVATRQGCQHTMKYSSTVPSVLHANTANTVDLRSLKFVRCHLWVAVRNCRWRSFKKTTSARLFACLLKSFLSQYLCFLFFAEKRITCCYRGDVFRVLNLLLYYQNNPWITSSEVTFPNNRLRTEAFTVVRVNYSSKYILG